MAPEELFSQLSPCMLNFCLKSYTFSLSFILYLYVWIRIRIHKVHEYGSGSTTLHFFSSNFSISIYVDKRKN